MFYFMRPILFPNVSCFIFRSESCTSNIPRYFLNLARDIIIYMYLMANIHWSNQLRKRVILHELEKEEMFVSSKTEKVPRGIRGEKSSKDMASSRNWSQQLEQ